VIITAILIRLFDRRRKRRVWKKKERWFGGREELMGREDGRRDMGGYTTTHNMATQ
jgi:hypothetical protein